MPNQTVPGIDKAPTMAHVYGNLSHKRARLTVPTGTAAGDLLTFLRLPKGVRIVDFFERHDGANSAATTAAFGLKACDGAGALDDNDYFLVAATDLNAAGVNRWANSAVYSVVLDEDYYVQAVVGGATTATAAMDVEVTVLYEFIGNL